DFFPGSENVRLDATIPSWSAARKIAHAIGVGFDPMGRTDRDDCLGIAWIGDADGRKLLYRFGGIVQHSLVAEIAGCGYDDDARCHCLLRFDTDRGLPACKGGRIMRDRKTHIDSVNVRSLRISVEVAEKLQSGDDDEFFARPIFPAHPHIDELDVATHPIGGTTVSVPIGGQDPRDMRSVTVSWQDIFADLVRNLQKWSQELPAHVLRAIDSRIDFLQSTRPESVFPFQ